MLARQGGGAKRLAGGRQGPPTRFVLDDSTRGWVNELEGDRSSAEEVRGGCVGSVRRRKQGSASLQVGEEEMALLWTVLLCCVGQQLGRDRGERLRATDEQGIYRGGRTENRSGGVRTRHAVRKGPNRRGGGGKSSEEGRPGALSQSGYGSLLPKVSSFRQPLSGASRCE